MENQALNEVVGRLLADRRFQRRFRVDPEGTLQRYGLSPQAVEAVKRGDADELLALGLSPELVWPELSPPPGALRRWLLRSGHTLAPAAFVAALLVALPAPAAAARATPAARILKVRAARATPAARIMKARAARRMAASGRLALYPHAQIGARALARHRARARA